MQLGIDRDLDFCQREHLLQWLHSAQHTQSLQPENLLELCFDISKEFLFLPQPMGYVDHRMSIGREVEEASNRL